MTDPIEIRRRLRRQIDRAGVRADVVADVNLVVSSGGGAATAHMDAPIRQGGPGRAGHDAADPKEQS